MASRRSPAAPSPVSLKLSDDERERLATLATARKRSSHYLMREAVREYLTREEVRQAFADEAEKAWLDYEQTGLHVTHGEIDAWAKSLGTRKPKRFPKWHK
jgi:predicted transcriptional regulator